MRRREKVNLYIRIEHDGKLLYAVPDLKKQLTAIIGDKPERHNEGLYYLRYEQDGRRRWEAVGADIMLAATKRKMRKAELTPGYNSADIHRQVHTKPKPVKKAASLSQAVDVYLQSVVATKAPCTAVAYKLALHQFAKVCTKPLAEVTQDDLTAFAVMLKQDGKSDRTIANRLANIVTFLNHQLHPAQLALYGVKPFPVGHRRRGRSAL